MKIVGIGGGTGLPVLLSGLKELSDAGTEIDITAIVCVSDNGGSTGALRDAFNIPAMGDMRKCMISLAADDSLLTSVCQHRFESPIGVAGHSLGNLILSALYQMSGNFAAAMRHGCELLALKGRVLPATEVPVTLCAMYEDGGVVRGESAIPQSRRRIARVWCEAAEKHSAPPGEAGDLDGQSELATVGAVESEGCLVPARLDREGAPFHAAVAQGPPVSPMHGFPPAAPGVIEALETADAIVFGPGSLYTSIIPNLLVAGVADAIQRSHAIKIYVSNLMTEAGETDGYSAADHLRALLQYLPGIDVCVLNSSRIGTGVAERYLKSGSVIVAGTTDDEDGIRRSGVIPVAAPLLKDGEIKARHDSTTLARLVVSLAWGFAGAQEIMWGQAEREVTCAESSDISVPEKYRAS